MKYRPHAFELPGDLPSLLFVGIGIDDEVFTADFDPCLGFIPREARQGGKEQHKRQNTFRHGGAPLQIQPPNSEVKAKTSGYKRP
jgi:hypothetical protein